MCSLLILASTPFVVLCESLIAQTREKCIATFIVCIISAILSRGRGVEKGQLNIFRILIAYFLKKYLKKLKDVCL